MSTLASSQPTRPTPGTLVEIKEGPFQGERGSVALMPLPTVMKEGGADLPVFFDEPVQRSGRHCQLVWVRPVDVVPLEGVADPWAEVFTRWLNTPMGAAALQDPQLTTGEILEILALPDGFGSQVRATKILSALGCAKVERIRGAWVWARVQQNEEPLVAANRNPSFTAFMLALNYFITWLASMPVDAHVIFQNLVTMCAHHNRPVKPEIVKWTGYGGSILDMLAQELRGMEVKNAFGFLSTLVLGFTSGRVQTDVGPDLAHRQIAEFLVYGRRIRALVAQGGPDECKRTPEVNGWVMALSEIMNLAMTSAATARALHDEAEAVEFDRQANALQWLIDAAGGPPMEGEATIRPKGLFDEKRELPRGHLDNYIAANWAKDLTEWFFAETPTPEAKEALQSHIQAALMQAAHGDILEPTAPTMPPGES